MALGIKRLFTVSILTCVLVAVLVSGCGQPPVEQAEKEGPPEVDAPEMPQPKKGNPKLDSHLWDLIEAEKQSDIRVEIECEPGQVEAVAKAVGALGVVEAIAEEWDLIQAVVPITSLNNLAEEESIRFIGLPVEAKLE